MRQKQRHHKRSQNRQNLVGLLLLLLCLLVGWMVWQHPDFDFSAPSRFEQAIRRLGWIGPLVYMGILVISVVVSPIPSAPLAVAAGMIWGPILAGIYSVIGGFVGGVLAYFIGYTLGRSTVRRLTGKLIYFSKRRGEVYLGWLIFITRLLPVFSFDLISYGAGITGLSLPIYVLSTLLGMIPSTFLLTSMSLVFTIEPLLGIVFSIAFFLLLIGLPYGIHRYNWFGMKDIIRVE